MPRVARIVIPGWPHHVTQRGNNRQDVFFVDDDRRVYLELLREQAERFGLQVLGYCLMTNHIHLIAVLAGDGSLAKSGGRTPSVTPALALGPRIGSAARCAVAAGVGPRIVNDAALGGRAVSEPFSDRDRRSPYTDP